MSALASPPLTAPVCLTDSPRVVALKREFRELDEREEAFKDKTKRLLVAGAKPILEQIKLQIVRERKAEIAREIFTPAERPPLIIGHVALQRLDNGQLWLTHRRGEGQAVNEEKLAPLLEEFFWKEF